MEIFDENGTEDSPRNSAGPEIGSTVGEHCLCWNSFMNGWLPSKVITTHVSLENDLYLGYQQTFSIRQYSNFMKDCNCNNKNKCKPKQR